MAFEDSLKQFKSYPDEMKAWALYFYFTDLPKNNMKKVAEKVVQAGWEDLGKDWSGWFSQEQPSRLISNITTCYGFRGKNAGIFSEITTRHGEIIRPEYDAYFSYVRQTPFDADVYKEERGREKLYEFLVDYYSKNIIFQGSSRGASQYQVGESKKGNRSNKTKTNSEFSQYAPLGCVTLIALLFVGKRLSSLVHSNSLFYMLILGILAYYSTKKTSVKSKVKKVGKEERWVIAVFIERFLLLFWIIGSCGAMLADGLPLWQVLMAMALIILIGTTVVRGIERVLRWLFGQ